MSAETIEPELLAQVRALYDAGEKKVSELAAMLKLTAAAFYALRARQGWPMRTAPTSGKAKRRRAASVKAKSAVRPSARIARKKAAGVFDAGAVTGQIETAVEQGIANAAQDLGKPGSPEAERNARMLASLTKALGELRKLQSSKQTKAGRGRDGQVERPARDMATLRADIARRLEEALRTGPAPEAPEEPQR